MTYTDLRTAVSKSGSRPLYEQLSAVLGDWIDAGRISAGDKLPGDLEMAEILDVSHITVRKAYERLVERGMIRRTRRAGTFVRDDINPPYPTIVFFYFAEAEEMMSQRAQHMQLYLGRHPRQPYDLKLIGFDRDYYRTVDLEREIARRDLAGAVIVSMPDKACIDQLRRLDRSGFPYVRFGNPYGQGELTAPLVRGNESQRIRSALEYLWERGHTEIGCVTRHGDWPMADEYRSQCKRYGTFREHYLLDLNFASGPQAWQNQPGSQIARGYMEQNRDLTACLVEVPYACADFLREANAMGRDVPAVLSLVSLMDWEGLTALLPAITSLSLSDREMGVEAAKLVVERVENGTDFDGAIHYVDYRLAERDSVHAFRKPEGRPAEPKRRTAAAGVPQVPNTTT